MGLAERHNGSMRARGLGRVYLPAYRDKRTRARKRSALWWIQYNHRGRTYRESSGSAVRSAAVQLLRRRLGEIGQGRLIGAEAERTAWEDLAQMIRDDYAVQGRKSAKRMEQAVAQLDRVFAHARALDLTSDRVTAFVRSRQEQGAKPASIRYELAILKRALALGTQAGKVVTPPHVPAIQVRNVRTGFFEEAALRDVVAHLASPLRAVAWFAYHTGWRLGEILPLRWRQVDLHAHTVRLEPGTTKNDEGRTFPFALLPGLADLIRKQRLLTSALEREQGLLIPWVFHRRGKPIRSMRKAWDLACEQAGHPGAWFHDLRRTAVRNLERAGVSRSVAMKLTGHKTEAVYRRYAIVSEADLSEGVRKLAGLHASEQSGQVPARSATKGKQP